jgi:hypothetical protein
VGEVRNVDESGKMMQERLGNLSRASLCQIQGDGIGQSQRCTHDLWLSTTGIARSEGTDIFSKAFFAAKRPERTAPSMVAGQPV